MKNKKHLVLALTASVALTAGLKAQNIAALPPALTECEPAGCVTLKFHGQQAEARWGNGTIGNLTVTKFDGQTITIQRTDSVGLTAGLSGTYTGAVKDNDILGKMTWSWPGHGNLASGTLDWKAVMWATAEPVKVSGAVAQKLEKGRAGAPCDPFLNGLHATTSARVEFTVLPDGSVTDVKELSHTGPIAYAHPGTLTRWTYNPYLVNGHATGMRVSMLFACTPGFAPTYE